MTVGLILKRLVLGILSVVGVFYILFFLLIGYQMSREPIVATDDPDLIRTINWLAQSGNPPVLVNSYQPPANWAGDYQKVFKLQLNRNTVDEVITRPSVVPADQATDEMIEAVRFSAIFSSELDWVPPVPEILTARYYLSPGRLIEQGERQDAVHLMIIDHDEATLHFIAGKL